MDVGNKLFLEYLFLLFNSLRYKIISPAPPLKILFSKKITKKSNSFKLSTILSTVIFTKKQLIYL